MGMGIPMLLPLTFTIDTLTLAGHWMWVKLRRGGEKGKDLEAIIDSRSKDSRLKEVSVIISSHGSEKSIEKRIRPVFEQSYPIKNVFVADSGIDNTRGVVERLMGEFPNLHYWSRPGLTGKSEKINGLIKDFSLADLGDFVHIKDSSANMAPDVLEKLVSKFKDSNTAAVTAYGFVTVPKDYLAKYFHYGKEWVNKIGRFRKTAQEYRRAMFVVCGASFMVRSDVLKKIEIPVGTQTEDTGYTWLLQEYGYRVRAAQDAVIQAEDVTKLKSQIKQSKRWYIGTWQNLYLHMREVLRARSKAKALGYSTIVPGLIETSLYSVGLLSLPVVGIFFPDYAKNFLIADTALTLASPVICLSLSHDYKNIPREFYTVLRHYHQVTAYKVMASAIWIYSGLKVGYDVISGKSNEWCGRWEKLEIGGEGIRKDLRRGC